SIRFQATDSVRRSEKPKACHHRTRAFPSPEGATRSEVSGAGKPRVPDRLLFRAYHIGGCMNQEATPTPKGHPAPKPKPEPPPKYNPPIRTPTKSPDLPAPGIAPTIPWPERK